MSEDITRSVAADRIMRLRYAGTCRLCRIALAARSQAIYEPSTKTVRRLECASGEVESGDEGADSGEPEPTRDVTGTGTAGSSARREYERRKAKDEERIRSRWGRREGSRSRSRPRSRARRRGRPEPSARSASEPC